VKFNSGFKGLMFRLAAEASK